MKFKSRLTLIYLFFGLLAIGLNSCISENDIVVESNNVIRTEIDPDSDAVLKSHLSKFTRSNEGGRVVSFSLGEVDLSKALKIENRKRELTRYTLRLQSNTNGSFRNLVVVDHEDNNPLYYVLEFIPDTTWLKVSEDYSTFTGVVKWFDINGDEIYSTVVHMGASYFDYYSNNEGRIDCSGDGSSGGTSGGGGGGDSSTGSAGGSTSTGGGSGISYAGEDCWLIIKSYQGTIIDAYVSCGGGPPSNRVDCLEDLPDSDCLDDDCPDDPIAIITPSEIWDTDQTFGKLCSENVRFKYSANSFTAEIVGLGGTYINNYTNQVISVELGINCVDLPEYHVATTASAAEGFTQVFNEVRTQIEHELDYALLQPVSTAVRTRMIQLLKSFLNTRFPGATFSSGGCQGDIPTTTADYGC